MSKITIKRLDQEDGRLSNWTIKINGKKQATIANAQLVNLELEEGEYDIQTKFWGYASKPYTLSVKDGQDIQLSTAMVYDNFLAGLLPRSLKLRPSEELDPIVESKGLLFKSFKDSLSFNLPLFLSLLLSTLLFCAFLYVNGNVALIDGEVKIIGNPFGLILILGLLLSSIVFIKREWIFSKFHFLNVSLFFAISFVIAAVMLLHNNVLILSASFVLAIGLTIQWWWLRQKHSH